MAAALVQSKVATSAGTASLAATLDAAPKTGNLIVAFYSAAALFATVTPQADYSSAGSDDDDNLGFCGAIYYKVAATGESATVTFATTLSVAATLVVAEFSGVRGASALDKQGANDPTGTGLSCATGTTGTLGQADELAVALVALSQATLTGQAWDSGFTAIDHSGLAAAAYKVTAATTALNPTFSWTTNLRRRLGLAATFRAAVLGTAAATCGGLSGTAAGTPTVKASAVSALGRATATALGTPTVVGTANAALDRATATAVGTPTVFGSASAALGALTDTAGGSIVHTGGASVARRSRGRPPAAAFVETPPQRFGRARIAIRPRMAAVGIATRSGVVSIPVAASAVAEMRRNVLADRRAEEDELLLVDLL